MVAARDVDRVELDRAETVEHGEDAVRSRRERPRRREEVVDREVAAGDRAGDQGRTEIGSPTRTVPLFVILAFMPRSRSRRPSGVLTNRSASLPNRPENLAQPVCGFSDTSISASPIVEPRPGRQVLDADVEVRVDLIAGERPARDVAGDRRCRPGVHDGELRLRIRRAIRCVAAPPQPPCVADQTFGDVQPYLVHDLPFVDRRASDDQLDDTDLGRCIADAVDHRFELVERAHRSSRSGRPRVARRADPRSTNASGCVS